MIEARRGAVRNEAAHLAILKAAASLVESVGYDKMTIEGIAAEAGVAKQTIYRWYPSKGAIVAECLMAGHFVTRKFPMPDSGDLRTDLSSWLREVFAYLSEERNAQLFFSLVAAAVQTPEISAQLAESLGANSPPFAERVARAAMNGQIRGRADPVLMGQAIFGVITIRIVNGAPFPAEDAESLVRMLVAG